jgi:hypothetical protein
MKSCDIEIGMEVVVKQQGFWDIPYSPKFSKAKVLGFEKVHKKDTTKDIILFEVEFADPKYECQRFAKVTSREILDTFEHYTSETEKKRKEENDIREAIQQLEQMRQEKRDKVRKQLHEYGVSIFDFKRDYVTINLDELEALLSKIR